MSSLYSILGIASSASQEEIQRAYRSAILTLHPDKQGQQHAPSQTSFDDVQKAWQVKFATTLMFSLCPAEFLQQSQHLHEKLLSK